MSDIQPQTAQDTDARIADLKAKLARREGMPGYERNVEAIKAEIARQEDQSK